MYIYIVGYGTCEESEYDHLAHEEQFTKEQFEEMIHTCALKAIKKMKETDRYRHSYQGIHNKLVQYLKEDFGFGDLEVEQLWTVFGWASLFKHGDWDTYRSEPDSLTALVDKVLAEGYGVKDDSFLSWKDRKRGETNDNDREKK